MKKKDKKTRSERTQINKEIVEYKQSGTGLYLFKNRSSIATLDLPKKSFDGKKCIGPNETWEGDSYYFTMIPREAVLIKTILDPKKEDVQMTEEKLLLDQPDQVTEEGKVEHVVPANNENLNEIKKESEIKDKKDALLTEDPLSGVTIICD